MNTREAILDDNRYINAEQNSQSATQTSDKTIKRTISLFHVIKILKGVCSIYVVPETMAETVL